VGAGAGVASGEGERLAGAVMAGGWEGGALRSSCTERERESGSPGGLFKLFYFSSNHTTEVILLQWYDWS
jgi:hypothetical protein